MILLLRGPVELENAGVLIVKPAQLYNFPNFEDRELSSVPRAGKSCEEQRVCRRRLPGKDRLQSTKELLLKLRGAREQQGLDHLSIQ